MRRPLLLAFLLLSGCSSNTPPTPQEACAREADQAPAVREELMKGAGTASYAWWYGERLQRARQDATLACLRARGLAPKGGVEQPRDSS